MRNAKKTLSLVMVAIFTTFIVLSGIPAGAVTSAQAKAQVTKATAAVVKVEKTVKVASFNPTTATTQLTAANKEVAKVKSLGTAYKKNYTALAARTSAVAKKITARKAAILAAAKKVYTDAEAAVTAAENATDGDKVDLVGDETALANAQSAVTTALEMIVKLNQDSSDYKGLMARIDAANNLIVKAMDEIAEAAAAKAAEEKAKADAEAAAKVLEAAVKAAETDVAALEAAPVTTLAEIDAAVVLGTKAAATVKAIANAEKEAPFVARIKAVADKGLAAKAAIEAKAAADAAAKLPATILSVSAVDGTITVTFNKKPITTPAAAQFVVTKTVTTTSAVTTTVVPTALAVVSDTAITLAVPAVASLLGVDQSVVYSVVYNATGAAVVAPAITIAKTPGLSVKSVSTDNLRNIKVVFSKAVKASTVTSSTVKVYSGTTVLGFTPVVLEDELTVIIPHSTNYNQMADYKVTVNGVQDKTTATDVVTGYENTIKVSDTTIPVVVSATATSPKTLKVVFSEPIQTGSAAGQFPTDPQVLTVVQIDGLNLYASGISKNDTQTEFTLTLGTPLTVGAHKVKVTGLKDYAGFPVVDTTFDVAIAADSTAPTMVSGVMKSMSTLEVTFDEPIDSASLTATNFKVDDNACSAATLKTDGKTVALTLGTGKTFSKSALVEVIVSYVGVKDNYGNAVSTAKTFTFKVTDDVTAPTVTATVNTSNTVELTFTEPVTISAGAFELYKADGTKLTNAISWVGKTIEGVVSTSIYTVTITDGATLSGAHELRIVADKIVDNSVRANKVLAQSLALSLNDKVAPKVSKIEVVNESGNNVNSDADNYDSKLMVTFSEAMDTATLTNAGNYIVAGTLLSEATATFTVSADKKMVTIIIDRTASGSVVAGTNLTTNAGTSTVINFLALKDTAGNILDATQMNASLFAVDYQTSVPAATAVASYQATSKNTVKVTMNTGYLIKSIDPNKFHFEEATSKSNILTLQVMGVAIAADAKSVVLTLNNNVTEDVKADGEDADTTTQSIATYYDASAITLTNDATVGAIADGSGVTLVDKVAPTIKSVTIKDKTTNADTIVLTYNEAVKISATDLEYDITVYDVTAEAALLPTDFTTTEVAGTIEIKVTKADVAGDKFTVALNNGRYISDGAGFNADNNHPAAFTAKNVVDTDDVVAAIYEKSAPTAPTALALTPVGAPVVTNTLNGSNTNMTATATITANEAVGGKAELLLGTTVIATDSTIAADETSVSFTLGTTTNAALKALIAAGGTVTVKVYDKAGNSTVNAAPGNVTLVVDYVAPTALAITGNLVSAVAQAGATFTDNVTATEDTIAFAAATFAATDVVTIKIGAAAAIPLTVQANGSVTTTNIGDNTGVASLAAVLTITDAAGNVTTQNITLVDDAGNLE